MADKQTTAVLKSLPKPIREAFEPFLGEKPMTTAKLRRTVDTYLERLVETASRVPSADPTAGRKAGDECIDMLDAGGTEDDESPHILVQAAVRYFVTASDAQSDLGEGGFDDDLEVIARVRETLDL
jgi:hypothetical protein